MPSKKIRAEKSNEEAFAELEAGFVRCDDLLAVMDFDEEADREGFYVLPSAGDGVIGKYAFLRDMENETPNIIVRKSVYQKLCDADHALKKKEGYENCQIIVTYGYRTFDIQKRAYEEQRFKLKQSNEQLSEEELREATHRLIAFPDVAGHPTGGAVDVTIFDYRKGKFLDLGTEIGDLTTKDVYYASENISKAAKRNRKVLRAVMGEQGFAPYDGEWWHFSYGDKEWAYYMHRRQSRDGSVSALKYHYQQKEISEIEIAYNDQFLKQSKSVADHQVRVSLAVQKEGRLTEETLAIFKRSGINITRDKRGFLAKSDNFPLDLLFVRDDDISNLVDAGVADLGIVGKNVYLENASQSIIIKELGFGKCFLALAVPKNSSIKSTYDLDGRRIATSYRNSTLKFLKDHNVTGAQIIDIAGSVEIAPLIDYADAIVDLVSTGSSLQQNKLTVIDKILESQSIMIVNRNIQNDSEKKAIIDRLMDRIESYLTAKQYKRVLMYVPRNCLDQVLAELTGIKTGEPSDERLELEQKQASEKSAVLGMPIVMPVYGFEDWYTIQVIIESASLWKKIEVLKENGVTNISFDDIEGIVQ